MLRVTITCPGCGYSRTMNESAIPQGVARATCPSCRTSFELAAAISAIGAEPPPPQPPSPAPPIGMEPPTPPRPRSQRLLHFSFNGDAREYFGIWIVNTLLKILSFGVYSAWAKVRKRRYFYGNTQLNSATFDYLADPMALFKGWLIGAGFFILYSIGTRVSPLLSGLCGLAFFGAMPWLIVRSHMFNQRNSAHRNIRFNFAPDYREAYVVFAGLPILIPFTLGFILPYMVYRQKRFVIENSSYGRTRCSFDASPKEFYLVFLKAIGWFLLLAVAFVVVAFCFSATVREFSPLFLGSIEGDAETIKKGVAALVIVFFLAINAIYLYFAIYVQTALANLTWNRTRIRSSSFVSTLRVRNMAWLYISSAVAIIFSLGLLIPWASIRLARYRFDNLALNLSDDLETFSAAVADPVGAAGEEIGDMFGIDIAL